MKKYIFILGMLLVFQFASVAQTTSTGNISKQFKIAWDKLSSAKVAVDTDYGGACCDTARMTIKLRAAKATEACLKAANSPLEILMILDNQYIDYPCCSDDDGRNQNPRTGALVKEIQATQLEWGQVLATKKAYADMLTFLTNQVQLKFVTDSVYDHAALLLTKQPLASYTPEQIVAIINIGEDVADDYGWPKADLQQAFDKLKATQIEFFVSQAKIFEEAADLPEN